MAYFIFQKNLDNINGIIFKIAEDEIDLNNLFNSNIYKIIEVSQNDFNNAKFCIKNPTGLEGNNIIYSEHPISFLKKELENYVKDLKNQLQIVIQNYPSYSKLNDWKNYLNEISSLNLEGFTYPFNNSLEKYFNDLGKKSFNPLQLP